jgi:hypothetical protein
MRLQLINAEAMGHAPGSSRSWVTVTGVVLLAGYLLPAHAVVLPEEHADAMYHYYDGGGVKVSGPALLVRKNIGDRVSVSSRYYMDSISSASPDVMSAASPYSDKREEFGLGFDVLHGNSLVSVFASSSKENDYLADTYGLNVSHELFGGLTMVSLGFSQGQDVVQRVDTSFEADINRYSYRLGFTQILNRSLLLAVNFEDIADEGYLSNPYRSVRVLGASQEEIYPGTRDSQALALRLVKGFSAANRPAGSSVRAEYRYFRDTWDIHSHTLGLAYQRYFGSRWLGELHYRYYQQSAASFYSDNFPAPMTYMARDKELSTFHSHSIGTKWSWTFLKGSFLFFDRASLNIAHDYISFSYDDYTDLTRGQLYSFGAHVVQLYISAWY